MLGAVREEGANGLNPAAPVEGVLVEAHDGPVYDAAGKVVKYDAVTGEITSEHQWIRTRRTRDVPESPTGGDECRIRDGCDVPERGAAAALDDDEVGPGRRAACRGTGGTCGRRGHDVVAAHWRRGPWAWRWWSGRRSPGVAVMWLLAGLARWPWLAWPRWDQDDD